MKKMRKRILLILFVLLNIGVIVWTATSEFSDGEGAAKLTDVHLKWWMIIPAILVFAGAVEAEIYKYYMLLNSTNAGSGADDKDGKGVVQKKKLWKLARRTVLLGRYYDNITPAAVGGQPFQIYFMHKQGVKKGYAAVIPLVGMVTDQLGFLIVGLFSIVVGSLTNAIWSPAVVAFGWIGLLCFAFFPIVIMAATFLPNTTKEIISIGIKFLAKIHIIKDRDAAQKKAEKSVTEYAEGIKTVLKTPGLFAKSLILGILYYVGLSLIPFFVLSAFGAEIGLFASFATTVAVSAAVYFVPTPGNAGAAEGLFYSVFSVLPMSGYVFWAMLLWRFFVYYAWIGMGAVLQARVYVEDKNLMSNWKSGVDKIEKQIKEDKKQVEKGKKR